MEVVGGLEMNRHAVAGMEIVYNKFLSLRRTELKNQQMEINQPKQRFHAVFAVCIRLIVFCGLLLSGPEMQVAKGQNSMPQANQQNGKPSKDFSSRPNIVLVFIDDMGWADFSCFGNTDIETSHIDRLAREGISFEQFYVNSPICSPSRTAISTGQYPQRWRIGSYLSNRKSNAQRGMANWLDPQAPMLARMLKQSGYMTGHFGKWHMGGQRDVGDAPLITEYGFDQSLTNFEGLGPRVLPLKYVPGMAAAQKHALGSDKLGKGPIHWEDRSLITASFTEKAIQFIKQAQKRKKPFYINLWPDDVHSPFHPPLDRYSRSADPKQKRRANYLAVLKTMDDQLGKLFDLIRGDQELRNNTLLLICSDNGHEPGCGSAGELRGAKVTLFEGGIRSPLVVWGPSFLNGDEVGGQNRDSIFSAIDLVPSLIELTETEVAAKPNWDGESVLQTLLGYSHDSRRKPLFFRRPPDRKRWKGMLDLPDLAIRNGPWKLLCDYDGSRPFLYNIFKDHGEEQNLALDPLQAENVKTLTQQVVDWHLSMPPDNGSNFK